MSFEILVVRVFKNDSFSFVLFKQANKKVVGITVYEKESVFGENMEEKMMVGVFYIGKEKSTVCSKGREEFFVNSFCYDSFRIGTKMKVSFLKTGIKRAKI